ncbi:MAG: pilus assembly protein TadG-related protein [Anaerolineales bacterium]|jgi:Flp pilus assembly protein TadG
MAGPGKASRSGQRGQALVLIAVAFIGLLAIVGLAVDGGQLFIGVDNLRRATDSAALDAANQIRNTPGVTPAELQHSAAQAISLNGITPTGVTVETCATNPGDPDLCKLFTGTTILRQLVRITAQSTVQMSFLTIIGIPSITVSANSIAEAASLDVVLAIDISESMTYDSPPGDPNRDPSICNPANTCQPFKKVKAAAKSFADSILWSGAPADNSDRVAVVYFSHGWTESSGFKGTDVLAPGWTNDRSVADTNISNMGVYQPDVCPTTEGPCRNYDAGGTYLGFECPLFRSTGDVSSCTTTNTGGALRLAGNMFALTPRKDAVWVVVLLTDGSADASDMHNPFFPYGYCPGTPGQPDWMPPFCRDNDVTTRHSSANAHYDAEDYAQDMADYVACAPVNPAPSCSQPGQGATIFTIGLGNQVLTPTDSHGLPFGGSILRYVADVGYEGVPNDPNDPCVGVSNFTLNCGNYFYAPTGSQLQAIFNVIAGRIFTRLTH